MDFSLFRGVGIFDFVFLSHFLYNIHVLGLIRQDITCSVEKTPYFYLYFTFLSPQKHSQPTCLRETLQKHEKGSQTPDRHILPNGPHLVVPQQAYKVTRTQNQVTVESYFMSLISRHPVYYVSHVFSPLKLHLDRGPMNMSHYPLFSIPRSYITFYLGVGWNPGVPVGLSHTVY